MVKNLLPRQKMSIRDVGSIAGSGRFPGEEKGNSLHSCMENPMNRGGWQAIVHGVAKDSDMKKKKRVRYDLATKQ